MSHDARNLSFFYFFPISVSPNNGTSLSVSFRYRVREETEPRRKAADKPETAERNETMGMDIVKQSVMDVLFDLMEMGEMTMYEKTYNDPDDSWDEIDY